MNNLKSLLLLLGAVIFGVGHVKLGIAQELVLPVGIQDEMPTQGLPNQNGYYVSGSYLSSYRGSFHAGVDIANGSSGGEIRSVADGVVVGTRNSATSSWGNAVLIKHETFPGGTIYSQYAHLLDGSVLVGLHCVEGSKNGEVCSTDSDCAGGTCKGDEVYAGQPIGAVGSTGTSEGSHLHFEIKQVGTFDFGYFNVHDEDSNLYQARRCSNNLSLKCHADADCVSPGTCIVKASSNDYMDPLEFIATNGDINLSSKFTMNDQVEVANGPMNVRAIANGTILGTQSVGAKGSVIGGPSYVGGYWWWNIDFTEGPDGWVAEDYLISYGTPSTASHPLNDTGITTCSDNTTIGLACPVADYPGQDAQFGRDAINNDDSDGHAGFSFTKLDSSGNPLPADATSWDCVKDNVTGLVWEVKTDDSGLHDKDWTYSWYEPDASKNGGDAGTPNGGSCTGSACDTQGYVQAVNAQSLCGASDWRMPEVNELLSIVNNGAYDPAIDTNYFPNTLASAVWSSSPVANGSVYAWFVISDGNVLYDGKTLNLLVRLVRGGQ